MLASSSVVLFAWGEISMNDENFIRRVRLSIIFDNCSLIVFVRD